ncbi:MAG: hypothetical protein ACJ768_12800 [Gaiellaceae bacterium]
MAEQLNLLGDSAQPVDDTLGPVQRAAMRVIRRTATMSWDEAGALAHAHSGKHSVDETCEFCGTDGAALLESLIRRRLVEPAQHGYVRLPQPPEDDGAIPF